MINENEQEIYHGHPSWRGMLSWYIVGTLVLLVPTALVYFIGSTVTAAGVFGVCFVILLIWGFVKRWATTYIITAEKLHIKRGILSRRIQESRLDRVQNVNCNQGVVDRILRVGRVEFDTAGTDDSEFAFEGIADPQAVVRAVDEAHRVREMTGTATDGLGRPLQPRQDTSTTQSLTAPAETPSLAQDPINGDPIAPPSLNVQPAANQSVVVEPPEVVDQTEGKIIVDETTGKKYRLVEEPTEPTPPAPDVAAFDDPPAST